MKNIMKRLLVVVIAIVASVAMLALIVTTVVGACPEIEEESVVSAEIVDKCFISGYNVGIVNLPATYYVDLEFADGENIRINSASIYQNHNVGDTVQIVMVSFANGDTGVRLP